jgi:hypothetical protein
VCGEVILSFYQNKNFWAAIIIFLPLLMVAVYYGLGIITSIYKTDFGSGVVIYADDYVKTGNWVSTAILRSMSLVFLAATTVGLGH